MPAKRKKAKKSPTTKASVDEKVAEKSASFKVVETNPTDEEKPIVDLEAVKEDTLPKEDEKTEEVETESKIPSITSFSQLDSQNSAPANSDSLPDEKDEAEKIEEVVGDNKKADDTEPDKLEKTSEIGNEKDEKVKKDLSSEDVKEWLKDVRPDTTKEVEKGRGSGLKVVIITAVVLAILGVIAGGVFYYQTGFNKETETGVEEKELNEAPVTTEAPEPAPREVDLSELSVEILNGSGIAGEAGKVDTLLTDLNFKETETGNADSYDYTTTVVSLKEGVSSEVYSKIEGALSENYALEKSDDVLEDDSEYDIKIIVGSQKAG
ncbi:LytR C-terminal domain-containing protein [Patescibacteria group bacterium]|nr:LytR C-terminal domain-containing protein [Patescibacteria group bacterium]